MDVSSNGRPLRVALVVPRFPSASETFVVQLFIGLLDRGWDTHVVCSHRTDTDTLALYPELRERADLESRVHVSPPIDSRSRMALRLPAIALRALVRAPHTTLGSIYRGWRRYGMRVIGRFYREAQMVALAPDIVHFQFGYDAVGREDLGDLLGCKLVASFQGYDINYAGIGEPRFYDELWKRADAVHFVSRSLEERARRRGFADDARGHVVLNGVDTTFFDPGDRRHHEQTGSDKRPLRILSVGRLNWTKGYEYALQAVCDLVDSGVACEYRIAGGGEMFDALRFTIDDLNLTDAVRLLGSLDRSRIRAEMRWADVLLHAAVSESFCLVVTEAQAMRLPVVSSDAGGLPENVADGETGFVVPRRDPRALAAMLAKLASAPGLRDRLGRAGRDRAVSHFDHRLFVSGIEQLYEETILRRGEGMLEEHA